LRRACVALVQRRSESESESVMNPSTPFRTRRAASPLRRGHLPHRQGLLGLAMTLLAMAPAAAQSAARDTVLIQGQRAAAAGAPTTLDTDALQRLRAAQGDTAALLRSVPGVSLQGAGGASSLPALHGMAGDRVRISVDGLDLIASCPNHMNPPLSYLDPAAVASLEVYAGISPVSAGGDSIAGSIVARTADPVFAPDEQTLLTSGELGAHARSNGRGLGINARVNLATSTLALGASAARSRADNYRAGGDFKTSVQTGRTGHTLPLDEVGSSAYDTRNQTLTIAHRGPQHLLEARLGYQEVPEQLYPNQRMDMLGNRQWRGQLRLQTHFDWGRFEARVFQEDIDHTMDFGADKRFWYGSHSGTGSACSPVRFAGDPQGTCAAGMPMKTASSHRGLSSRADIAFGDSDTLRLGAEWLAYRLDDWWPPSGGGMGPGTFDNIRDGRRDRGVLYGEWIARPSAAWSWTAGARVERVRSDAGTVHGYNTLSSAPGGQAAEAAAFNASSRLRTDDNLDLSAIVRHAWSGTLDLEGGIARKVRSPNLYERYTWSSWAMAATMNNFVGDGNGYVGNPDLKPEVAHTVSATIDWHAADRAWNVRATPYLTEIDDYIDAVRRSTWSPGKFNVLGLANQSARIIGLDLTGRAALPGLPGGDWTLEGVLNLTRGRNRDSGDDLFQIMPANLRVSLNHRLGNWQSALEVVSVAHKRRINDVRNEIATPGYTLLNLRAGTTWGRMRLDFGIDNLFDRHYALPTGGAYIGQGTTMSINGVPWGVAMPGPGRSIYLAGQVRF
jgi:iron complex outermembrane receptor protein